MARDKEAPDGVAGTAHPGSLQPIIGNGDSGGSLLIDQII
jgi:hypothetical protein